MKGLNLKTETLKLLDENIDRRFFDKYTFIKVYNILFDLSSEAKEIKQKETNGT